MGAEHPIEGSIWDNDGELVMVEKVYEAKRRVARKYQPPSFEPITLVKHKVIEAVPHHQPLSDFLERYKPYDPEAD